MRELVLFIATSEDGYIATTEGSIDWLTTRTFSEGEDGGFASFYDEIDTILVARKTFEHVMKLTGGIYPHQDRKTILVTTRSNYSIQEAYHGSNIVTLSNEVVSHIKRLKEEEGKAIWLCGGSSIINQLMHAKLIDRLIVTLVPIQLGEGIPLWDAQSISMLTDYQATKRRNFDGCTQTIFEKGNF